MQAIVINSAKFQKNDLFEILFIFLIKMAHVPLITEVDEQILDSVYKNDHNYSELTQVLVENLVKIAEEKDLYTCFIKTMGDVELFNFTTVWYTCNKNSYVTSEEGGGLFQKTLGDIGDKYETKVSRLSDLFYKMPRNLIMKNGKEHNLNDMLHNLDILPIVSYHLGNKCWVSLKNIETVEYYGFKVSKCSICVTYMPDGLTHDMKNVRNKALEPLNMDEIDACSKACYCEY